jgi:hypothetical protein
MAASMGPDRYGNLPIIPIGRGRAGAMVIAGGASIALHPHPPFANVPLPIHHVPLRLPPAIVPPGIALPPHFAAAVAPAATQNQP